MSEIEKEKGDLKEEDIVLNIEAAFKSAFYMHFRYLYNNAKKLNISKAFYIAIYFYIREFCYSSMFRYNTKGEFNVPYGGISYNKKHLTKKIEYFTNKELLEHLAKTKMCSLDFLNFCKKTSLILMILCFWIRLTIPNSTHMQRIPSIKVIRRDLLII